MLKIYNSLTRKLEVFDPEEPLNVGVYACGPTVYSFVTIGNWRTYTLADLFVRAINYLGFSANYIMNITDVGHLTGDNMGDADSGEDRMEKASKEEGKSASDIAEFYTKDFLKGYAALNLTRPTLFSKATEHIDDQIDLVSKIEDNGFTYKIDDGVYFDVAAYEKAGHKYGELSTLDKRRAGARVKFNLDKHDSRDFALWKFSHKGEQRQMEWGSPWGTGFPGWHVECSAMAMKYLGERFDVHIGGEDLQSTHHPNEVAQSEAATGKTPFVRYWLHGAFVQIDGGRMGKSLGNAYTLHDLEKRGIEPLALRYLYLTTGYRDKLNFTWDSLAGAQAALNNLRDLIRDFKSEHSDSRESLSPEKLTKVDDYNMRFKNALESNLNVPSALAVMWEAVKSNLPRADRLDLALSFDEVLGLKLGQIQNQKSEIPKEIQKLVDKREEYRREGKYTEADMVRREIEDKGFSIKDTSDGVKVTPNV